MSAVISNSLATIDLAAVKSRQQALLGPPATMLSWCTTLQVVGGLCESLDSRSGSRVLDVAAERQRHSRGGAPVRRDLYTHVPSLLESQARRVPPPRGTRFSFRKPMRRTCHSATRRLTW